MISNELYKKVLIDPCRDGANKLLILSGYASAPMAYKHVHELLTINSHVQIELYIGMCARDGISRANHDNFKRLSVQDHPNHFRCYYTKQSNHAKAFVWSFMDSPTLAFMGSANYTQTAFGGAHQQEVMIQCDADSCFKYIKSVVRGAIDCNSLDAETRFHIFDIERVQKIRTTGRTERLAALPAGSTRVEISLLVAGGRSPDRSGLNWGQREGREPNQAYLALKADVYQTDFFPPIATRFTVITDDGQTFICTRAQQNGKAIHTPENNSLLGLYFRRRLRVEPGDFVTIDHLRRYGRTTVDFVKIDEETYFMDFGV